MTTILALDLCDPDTPYFLTHNGRSQPACRNCASAIDPDLVDYEDYIAIYEGGDCPCRDCIRYRYPNRHVLHHPPNLRRRNGSGTAATPVPGCPLKSEHLDQPAANQLPGEKNA